MNLSIELSLKLCYHAYYLEVVLVWIAGYCNRCGCVSVVIPVFGTISLTSLSGESTSTKKLYCPYCYVGELVRLRYTTTKRLQKDLEELKLEVVLARTGGDKNVQE